MFCAARRSHRATPCAHLLRPAAPTSPFISLRELPGGVGGRGGGDAFQACREIGCFRSIGDIRGSELIAPQQPVGPLGVVQASHKTAWCGVMGGTRCDSRAAHGGELCAQPPLEPRVQSIIKLASAQGRGLSSACRKQPALGLFPRPVDRLRLLAPALRARQISGASWR